jgi:hypothetical protein
MLSLKKHLLNVGFRAPKHAYDNIGSAMGVVTADDSTQGVVYGANSPKPAKVRISYKKGLISAITGDTGNALTELLGSQLSGSATRWCEPDKIGDVTVGKALNKQTVRVGLFEYEIDEVTIKNN